MLLVVVAVLGGASALRRADASTTVYVAARDLPSSVPLAAGDLVRTRVRLPGEQLRLYLSPPATFAGDALTGALARGMLVPAGAVVGAKAPPGMATVTIPGASVTAIPAGLRPGARVRLLATYADGDRRKPGELLLDAAEVQRVDADTGGLTGGSSLRGVTISVPAEVLPRLATAIATAKILIAELPDAEAAGTAGGR